jgi:hypothetical protein
MIKVVSWTRVARHGLAEAPNPKKCPHESGHGRLKARSTDGREPVSFAGACVVLALLAGTAQAQTVAAGARAVVGADTLPVYAKMSQAGDVLVKLKRGEIVTIGLVLFDSDITWCAISRVGETKRLGFASCEFLEPDRAAAPVEPPGLTPPPAPAPKPVTIREPAPIPLPPPKPPPVGPPSAPKPVTAPADFVDNVLDGLGLRSAIANYTQTTRLLSFIDKGRLAEIDVPTLERVVGEQFQPGPFYQAIGDRLRKGYTPERVPALSEWLHSPLARKLADLEQRAYSPDSRDKLVEYAGSLSTTPPPQPRLLLVHRLYEATRTCDMEVEATIALVHTTAQAISPALPKEKRYGANELDRALGGVKSRYRSVMRNAKLVQYLFAFQSTSDAELEQYAGFLESDNGKWLISAVDKGFFDATGSISRQLRAEIPRNLKAKRP